MEISNLIGDLNQNLYKLGLIDKKDASIVLDDVKLMIRTPWAPVNKIIEEIAKEILKNTLLKNPNSYEFIKSYAEGLGKSIEECAFTMLVPEIVSSLSKWIPTLKRAPFGCSSFVTKNPKGEVLHGRILDFPLHGTYDIHERALNFKIDGLPKMLSFGAVGIPYPSITFMNEFGITLALHEKFTNVFNYKGQSIFEYIFKLSTVATDKEAILDFINNNQTFTTWCLNITFKDGTGISVDIGGEKPVIFEYTIPDHGILYFNNKLLDPTLKQEDFIPYGFSQYNDLRESLAKEKIDIFMSEHGKNPTEAELLKLMSSKIDQAVTKENFNEYRLDNINCSSLSVMVLNPTAQKAYYLKGEAPKFYKDSFCEFTNVFSDLKTKEHTIKAKDGIDHFVFQGNQALMKAQKAFDKKDASQVYNQLQLAIDYLENQPEEHIARFYFLVAQFIYENHDVALEKLLKDFKSYEDKLPSYLNDQCLMFIWRLERILNLHPSVETDKITSIKLKNILKKEELIPRFLFKSVIKNMMIPRIDILDIIYLMNA